MSLIISRIYNSRLNQTVQSLNFDMKNRRSLSHDCIELPDEGSTVSRLNSLAEKRKLSPAEIAVVAIGEFIEREERQLSEIEAAIREAEPSDFASDEDVTAVLFKYTEIPSEK
ncbi:CopG family ribbon-helix-helix protein [Rhizobium leguminosarum]|uniref:CopG family ribbon-helix-helix protein n=1 Tax=Rhizobium leguminosarum TaxID=384 RepID=UPI00027D83EB|nr:hypothetical protein [Rhizobium leguminosarum]